MSDEEGRDPILRRDSERERKRRQVNENDKPPSPVYAAAAQGLGIPTETPLRSDARGYLGEPASMQQLTVDVEATGLLKESAVEAFVEQVNTCFSPSHSSLQ